eukprot:900634-Amphidinium_carterae.1
MRCRYRAIFEGFNYPSVPAVQKSCWNQFSIDDIHRYRCNGENGFRIDFWDDCIAKQHVVYLCACSCHTASFDDLKIQWRSWPSGSPLWQELQDFIQKMDMDNSGTLSWDEFQTHMQDLFQESFTVSNSA